MSVNAASIQISLVPCGSVSPALLDYLKNGIKKELKASVAQVEEGVSVPSGAYDPRRRQYQAEARAAALARGVFMSNREVAPFREGPRLRDASRLNNMEFPTGQLHRYDLIALEIEQTRISFAIDTVVEFTADPATSNDGCVILTC